MDSDRRAIELRHKRERRFAAPRPSALTGRTSIFHHHRLDYETILELIPPGASVLDLGCGTGGLLARLRDRGHRRIVGIEWDEQAIVACVRRGLDVVQADLNKGLAAFADGQFDFVVLSQTLQTVLDVPRVLRDMCALAGAESSASPTWPITSCGPNWPSRAGRREYTPNTASNGTTRPICDSSRSPISRSSAGSRVSRSTSRSPWTPKPTAVVATIPNLNADVAVMVLSC